MHCPFTRLAQSPEGCSSLNFPETMGISKSSEMLLLNATMNADEALTAGIISRIFPQENFEKVTSELLKEYSELPKECLRLGKGLIRSDEKMARLKKVALEETRILEGRWTSDECSDAIQSFFSSRN